MSDLRERMLLRPAQLKRDYEAQLGQRAAGIDILWCPMVTSRSETELAQLHLHVHTLAGAAGVYGLCDISLAAVALATALDHAATLPLAPLAGSGQRVPALFDTLRGGQPGLGYAAPAQGHCSGKLSMALPARFSAPFFQEYVIGTTPAPILAVRPRRSLVRRIGDEEPDFCCGSL